MRGPGSVTTLAAVATAASDTCTTCAVTRGRLQAIRWNGTMPYELCADWVGCPLRQHPNDPAWDRCPSCSDEYKWGTQVVDGACDWCTNHGVY